MLGSNGPGFRDSMRMYYCAVTVALFASLALSQTSSISPTDAPPDAPVHHRHDDDDKLAPVSAALVPADSPVITIKGACDHPPGAAASSVQAKSSTCETIITKAQFEKLAEALNPQMSAKVKYQLAETYPHLLVFANKARELGLDQDSAFAEEVRFTSLQLLTDRLNRYYTEQAVKNISDSDVEEYYKKNATKYEREELLRIFVPKQTRQGQKTPSAEHSGNPSDSAMLKVAEKIHARAAAGEDFQVLQKEAFEAAGIASGPPTVSTGRISAVGLPLDHRKVFEMEPGQVSDAIADSSGYYIYKVVSKQMVPLVQASREIRRSIASQRVQDATAALSKSFKSNLDQMYFGPPGTDLPAKVNETGDEPSPK